MKIEELAKIEVRPRDLSAKDDRAFCFATKDLIWEFETTNQEYIVFYHRDHQWWQCGDNSAMIYFYYVVPLLKLHNIRLWPDADYSTKRWRHGAVTIHDIKKLQQRLKQELKYKLVVDTEEIRAFKVDKKFSKEELAAWQDAENNKREQFNALVVPKNPYPIVMSKIAAVHRVVVNKVAKLDSGRRECYGRQGVELVSWLSMNVIAMSNGRIEKVDFFAEAEEKLNYLNDWLAYVNKFGLFDVNNDLRLAQQIRELKDLIHTEYILLGKNGAE